MSNLAAQKNGYLLVYVSNESNFTVFFDNLQVVHKPGPITEENHYYPFGLVMNGISSKGLNVTADNKLKFNGKEEQRKEFFDGSGLDWLDFGARMYDNQIGRFFNVDPKVSKMPGVSPYVFCFNNPLIYVDPDGQYPIYILTRAYAPFKTFGPNNNWFGDNRGHTLDRGASYRSLASINYDTETRKTQAFGGHSRSHTIDGKKDAISPTLIDYRTKSGSNFIEVHSVGTNDPQFGAQPIDQFTKLTVTTEGNIKNNHILNISGTVSGDNFPNQESMVFDSKGNGLWLGNFETSGDRHYGPVKNLFFDDEGDVQINVNIRIGVNKDGVFQGVMQKRKDGKETMIPIGDWNKKFKSDDNK